MVIDLYLEFSIPLPNLKLLTLGRLFLRRLRVGILRLLSILCQALIDGRFHEFLNLPSIFVSRFFFLETGFIRTLKALTAFVNFCNPAIVLISLLTKHHIVQVELVCE